METVINTEVPFATTKRTHNQRKTVTKSIRNMPLPSFTLPPPSPSKVASGDVTYNANALDQGTSLRRFRTPAPHDVLSGRGGSVNAHPGNCQFRDWVHLRKEEYNLAKTKQAKADICRTVIAQVVALGGRFLVKESPNSPWWIEQDEERIMAKTSQALREGAPKIREAHREELGLGTHSSFSRRKPRSSVLVSSNSTIPVVPSSKRPLNLSFHGSDKRVRVDYKGHVVRTDEDTPPLRSTDSPKDDDHANLQDFQLMPAPSTPRFPPPLSRARLGPQNHLSRAHSLAVSDIVADESYEFVNPFDDESDLFDSTGSFSSATRNSFSLGSAFPRPGIWRESSVSSTTSDFAGFGALIRGPTEAAITSNKNFSFRMTPEASTTAHIVDSCEDDNRSVASESTIGLPLWDWFNRDDVATSHPIPPLQ